MAAAQEVPSAERPSFSSFWKRTKDGFNAKRITFVQGNPTETSNAAIKNEEIPSEITAKDKAQIRRAQVRKAQIQHRQRKANYIRKLELDISGLRDMIASTEKDRRVLLAENDMIRQYLRTATEQDASSQLTLPCAQPAITEPSLFDNIDLSDVTVTLGMDDLLRTPVYQISGSSSPESTGQRTGSQHSSPAPADSRRVIPELTTEQTQEAVNFILALEHICWDHFGPEDFASTSDSTRVESGHCLMASSLALQSAPQNVFTTMGDAGARVKPESLRSDVSWQASGLTLQSLHGLASSVNPSDLDLTPVQAWFELASVYPMSILLRRDIVDALKRGFSGVVKCPQYGAVIERSVFDSVVGRVLEPELAAYKTRLTTEPAAEPVAASQS
ncbi:Alanine racemase [Pleurostoma richardsiae]|uniref:Alanine racemase n=1 Tax=Pleurostoma richardsiae TaxID=41990 RepID=A0AA38S707_9PEZI|nr:Alanine racemase [Pleurostoma richardsiae]